MLHSIFIKMNNIPRDCTAGSLHLTSPGKRWPEILKEKGKEEGKKMGYTWNEVESLYPKEGEQ